MASDQAWKEIVFIVRNLCSLVIGQYVWTELAEHAKALNGYDQDGELTQTQLNGRSTTDNREPVRGAFCRNYSVRVSFSSVLGRIGSQNGVRENLAGGDIR